MHYKTWFVLSLLLNLPNKVSKASFKPSDWLLEKIRSLILSNVEIPLADNNLLAVSMEGNVGCNEQEVEFNKLSGT